MCFIISNGNFSLSGELVQYIHYHHSILKVMVFITCNQCMYQLTNELVIFNPFAMHAVLGRIDNNALPILAV